MSDTHSANLNLTHSIINYQSAQLRGHLAFINALLQLSHSDTTPEMAKQTELRLLSVVKWNKELLNGIPIFSTTWRYAETTDAQKSLDLLGHLLTDISQINSTLTEILAKTDPFYDQNDLKFIIACSIRYAYSRENFFKGAIEFATYLNQSEVIQQLSSALAEATAELKKITATYKEYRQQGKLSEERLAELKESTTVLSRIFRSYEHDIKLFLSIYQSEFTFADAGIAEQEVKGWQDLNFNAREAGYWKCYDFKAPQAVEWFNVGVVDPSAAFVWTMHGFRMETAIGWFEMGLTPKQAHALVSKGYTPNTFYDFVAKQTAKNAEKSAA